MAPRPPVVVSAVAVAVAVVIGAGGAGVFAHATADLVAVPAGSEATVTLKPTHGCGDSPTVEVRIRVPLEAAEAGSVEGWTATSEPDDEGNTIVGWAGGVLAADEAGAFPVTFTAPDEVGRLLVFPAIQRCADGEELAWIDGDPDAEFPAPRLLVLAADGEPAETVDDVPLDAPGRDQLVEVLDVDGPPGSVPDETRPDAPEPAVTTG